MSKRQEIRAKMISSTLRKKEFEMPGEPLIYSIKVPIGMSRAGALSFRVKQWRSILKCHFPSYFDTKVPVVVLVRFYVKPPEWAKVKAADVRGEKTPAVEAAELGEFYFSTMELLHHTLFNSYRQVVKVDMEKYYSNNPRTVLKFMKWEAYATTTSLEDKDTAQPKSQEFDQARIGQVLQPECTGNEESERLRHLKTAIGEATIIQRAPPGDMSLPHTRSRLASSPKKESARSTYAYKSPRRRQPGEVPQ